MAPRKPRNLSHDETELWHRIAESARPLHPKAKTVKLTPPKDAVQRPAPAQQQPRHQIQPFRVGEAAPDRGPGHVIQPGLAERIAGQPVRMDRRAFDRMARGKLRPEAKIDLHGMTLAQAHPALSRFILRAHAEGLRLVLVVTGKGRDRDEGGPIPAPRGVLRHQVPMWLHQAPLSGLVLQIAQAHQRHGGGGAYYVYLRRSSRISPPPAQG